MSKTYGECVVTEMRELGGQIRLHVDRADPQVRISPDLLARVPRAEPGLDWPATYDPDARILRIEGVNRTVVYRIRDILEPTPGMPGHWDYVGEWPD